MKRATNLFSFIISENNLSFAIDEVNRTHRWEKGHHPNPCTAWVEETKEDRVQELRRMIVNGFVPNPPRVSERWDKSAGKWRTVSEPLQWPDQYIHHALIQVLQPILMRGMDYYCCGSVPGKGAHHAMRGIQRWMQHDVKGTKYEFCGDIRHFYDSLKPEVVMERMRYLIKDHLTLDLIWRIIKDGILIGAYPSQWFANAVLQPLDHLIRQSGLCKHYVRYMDNLTIFGPNKRKLRKLKVLVEGWLHDHQLELKGDWQIFPTRSRLPDAVGYRYGREFTLPRKRNLLRLKRSIAKYRKRRQQGRRISARMAAGILSRLGQLKHCSNCNLYRMLFREERLVRELKRIIRKQRRKEELTWNMYLEQRAMQRCSKSKAIIQPT